MFIKTVVTPVDKPLNNEDANTWGKDFANMLNAKIQYFCIPG